VAGSELGSLAWEDVQVATNVISVLADHPQILGAKALRGLRAALRPLVLAQLRRYEPVNYAARVSAALQGKRWHEALGALEGLRDLGEPAKAGTVQRWVRQCDECPQHLHARLLGAVLLSARPSEVQVDGGCLDAWGEGMVEEPEEEEEAPQCLGECTDTSEVSEGGGKAVVERGSTSADCDGEIRSASPADDHESLCNKSDLQPGHEHGAPECATGATSGSPSRSILFVESPFLPQISDPVACGIHTLPAEPAADRQPPNHLVLHISTSAPSVIRILYIEPAAERQPPNHHDLHIHASAPHAIAFCPTPPPVARRPVPGVPGAFVLDKVLMQEECAAILSLAHIMGFRADHPVASPLPSPTYAAPERPAPRTAPAPRFVAV
jgi:hypothetical protein